MAVYTTPSETHEHYVERDSGSSAGAIWAVVVVLLILFAILFFGTNVFGNRSSKSNSGGIDVKGSIQSPSGATSGAGSGTYTQPK
jgi:hypothetical protein